MIDQTNTPWNKLVSEKNGKTCYGALELVNSIKMEIKRYF